MTVVDPDTDPRVGLPEHAEALWAEAILRHDDVEIEWYDERIDSRLVPRWDVESFMWALEQLGPVDMASFQLKRGRVPVSHKRITVSFGVTRSVPDLETHFAYARGDEAAIAWLDAIGPGEVVVCCCATSDAYRDEVLSSLETLAAGPASTWRGQAVQLDPHQDTGFRHLAPRATESPGRALADGLRRNLVIPLQQFDTLGTHVPRRGVLLHGRPGTGKSWSLEWVIGQVIGPVTAIVATPSVVGNGPLMRHAFDMAADATPSFLVLEDLDVGAGHRMLSPAAFGELLNAMDGPGRTAGVFVAATTNNPEMLDPAISQRPGRFDVTLEVDEAPDEVRRKAVEDMAADLGITDDDEITDAVRRTKGYSMAEVAAVGQMAWLVAADTGEAPSFTAAFAALSTDGPSTSGPKPGVGYA